ncbi:MAG: hypothetical protein V5B30_03875 [Candidatus Accumulibacter delftensis]
MTARVPCALRLPKLSLRGMTPWCKRGSVVLLVSGGLGLCSVQWLDDCGVVVEDLTAELAEFGKSPPVGGEAFYRWQGMVRRQPRSFHIFDGSVDRRDGTFHVFDEAFYRGMKCSIFLMDSSIAGMKCSIFFMDRSIADMDHSMFFME